jgi:ribosomal protein S1
VITGGTGAEMRRVVISRQAADEVRLQETLLEGWQKREEGRVREGCVSWLTRARI